MSECLEVGSRATSQRRLRKMYGLTKGDGKMVCHHCDNSLCVLPEHTYVGNALTNNRDAASRKRYPQQNKETCPQGHPLDGVRKNWNGNIKRYCKTCAYSRNGQRRKARRAAA